MPWQPEREFGPENDQQLGRANARLTASMLEGRVDDCPNLIDFKDGVGDVDSMMAVSIVKAGARIVAHDAGPVRAPLSDLADDEFAALRMLVEAVT